MRAALASLRASDGPPTLAGGGRGRGGFEGEGLAFEFFFLFPPERFVKGAEVDGDGARREGKSPGVETRGR